MTIYRTPLLLTAGLAILFRASATGQTSSIQQNNDAVVKRVAATIAGHEREPADEVFKNVDRLKDTDAGTLLVIMNIGYAKALGVACSYCHDEDDFASDDKRPKRAAREMQVMHRAINDQLRGMKNLSSEASDRSINCNACHRGEIRAFRG